MQLKLNSLIVDNYEITVIIVLMFGNLIFSCYLNDDIEF